MSADELKKLRKQLGLSISQAARCVHVTDRSWLRYEAGDRKIPEAIVHLFCLRNKVDYRSMSADAGKDLIGME